MIADQHLHLIFTIGTFFTISVDRWYKEMDSRVVEAYFEPNDAIMLRFYQGLLRTKNERAFNSGLYDLHFSCDRTGATLDGIHSLVVHRNASLT